MANCCPGSFSQTVAPAANSGTAAAATARNNSLCIAIQPFYWEIGDQDSALASGSLGTDVARASTSGTRMPSGV